MRRDDQHFDLRTHEPIEDVVREACHAIFANIWWILDAIPAWGLTDFIHCVIESQQIACSETLLARFVVGNMPKVFNACGFIEKVTHLSKAIA